MTFFRLLRFTVSMLGQPTSETVISDHPTVEACHQAIREQPATDKKPGIRFECRRIEWRA